MGTGRSVDLSISLHGVRLANPLVLVSGIWGTQAELLVRAARGGAGAVTSKSCGLEPRAGHKNPTVLDWGHGLINAVGLTNPGVNQEVRELVQAREQLSPLHVPLIASVFADSVEGFARVSELVSAALPDFVELNISCPNVEAEMGRPFALDCASAAAVTRAARRAMKLPLIVKLSPNVPDVGAVARAVEDAGADVIAAVNTVGPGMVIDVGSGRPVLANRVGGLSGPAIRPIAVRCVYDIAAAVRIPVVGIGGVTTGRDALEMIMAGATAVGIGSAVYYRGEQVFVLIRREMEELMRRYGYESLNEIRSIAHESP